MPVVNSLFAKDIFSKKQKGLSMIEVLVSVLVMSIGLTGLAGLQISSVNNATISYVNTQAIFALQDMAGRLLSSVPAAKAGDFNIPVNLDDSLKTLSDLSIPTGSSLQPEKDKYYWLQNLSEILPNAKASLMCDTGGVCVISVQFSDVDKKTTAHNATNEQKVVVKL